MAHDITNLVKELGLRRHPDRIADNAISEDTLAIHIWNHLIEKLKRNALPAGSFISILRTELSGYNTVGEEIRIVWMGFNEGWVQV